MTVCPECATAARKLWGLYMRDCAECRARMLAHSPSFHASRKAEKLTPAYRAALAMVRTDGESLESAHQRVRQWERRIKEVK